MTFNYFFMILAIIILLLAIFLEDFKEYFYFKGYIFQAFENLDSDFFANVVRKLVIRPVEFRIQKLVLRSVDRKLKKMYTQSEIQDMKMKLLKGWFQHCVLNNSNEHIFACKDYQGLERIYSHPIATMMRVWNITLEDVGYFQHLNSFKQP